MDSRVETKMVNLENHEKKSISKISRLFRKHFVCQERNRNKPKRFISYKTIDIKCPAKHNSTFVKDESPYEIISKSPSASIARKRNPESATVSSANNLPGLVPALRQFKLSTAVSRWRLR